MARALRRDQEHVQIRTGFDDAEVDGQTMSESQGSARLQVLLKAFLVQRALAFIRRQDHDNVGPGSSLTRLHHLETGFLSLLHGGGGRTQADDDVGNAAVLEVVGVCVTLAAIANDRDFLALDQIQIGIAIVIHPHQTGSFLR